ncbi:MAG: phosphoenolpyruvate--protein phosphotransferase [candidate division WOR-3 bacterium]
MTRKRERIFRGIPVSHGFASGRVFRHQAYLPSLSERVLQPGEVTAEVQRFRKAVRAAEQELRTLYEQVRRDMGKDFAAFIDVQLALVTDEVVLKETERFIAERLRNAEFAYAETLKRLSSPMGRTTIPLFRERTTDVTDVSARVLRHLLNEPLPTIHELQPGSVIVAHDLPPSAAALLDPAKVAAVVLEAGGKTSHTAIMAKTKEIPAVVGAESVCRLAVDGQEIFVDAYRGLAILNPAPNRLRAYQAEIRRYMEHRETLTRLAQEEPVTLDGKMIDLSANIEFLVEARVAKENGARGIGLFRTEYMYLAKAQPPSEEEQYQVFAEVARLMKPYPVIIRTFDLGGDKVIPGYVEANPFLGWRAIRMCFDNQELFKTQLRAILRASTEGNVKVMLPMVATLEELRRAKLLLEEAKKELRKTGRRFDEEFELGVMVEIPSAAIIAHKLARECSFLSIGSNDLTQYTLAVDRGNQRVAKLFDHFHPAVLHLIKRTIDAAHEAGIWVGMCGEFGSEPLGILILLGLGIDEISVVPGFIAEAKNIIRSIDTTIAAEVVSSALALGTTVEVERLLRRELHKRFPRLAASLFELNQKGADAS